LLASARTAPHQWCHGDPSARQQRLGTAGATAQQYYGGTAAWRRGRARRQQDAKYDL